MADATADRRAGTRERILDAAAEIVRADGVGAATTKRIAIRAGLSEGTLYNHFADKPDLLISLVLERLPSIRSVFEVLYAGAGTVPLADRLAAALRAMIGFYAGAQPIVGGVLSDPHLLALCRRRFADRGEGPQSAHEKLGSFLAAERAAGRLRPEADPHLVASLLIGACTEYASLHNLTGTAPGGRSREDYAGAIVGLLAPLFADAGVE